MFSILLTLFIFFFVFLIQLVVVRVFHYLHIHTFFSFFIHAPGLIIVVALVFAGNIPYTAILIYILLTLLLMTSSLLPLLGGNSPASVIVTTIEKEKKMTVKQLYKVFDEKDLILVRLDDLVDVGFVNRRGGVYVITQKGILISQLIGVCRRLIGLGGK